MSYPMEDQPVDPMPTKPGGSGLGAASIGMPMTYRIARNGARPLHFKGSELAMAMSYTPELPYWYEVNLYRTSDAEFVVAIRLFHQSEEQTDTVEAWRFPSLEQALEVVETYDPAHDVKFFVPSEFGDTPASELAARALDLQWRISAARRHYQGLVGELLSELDVA